MKIETTRMRIHTAEGVSLYDLTPELDRYVAAAGVRSGLCVIDLHDLPCSLALVEDLDESYEDVIRVARATLDRAAGEGADDRLDEFGGGLANPVILARSLTLPIENGRPAAGSWTTVLLVESSGGLERHVDVTLLGE